MDLYSEGSSEKRKKKRKKKSCPGKEVTLSSEDSTHEQKVSDDHLPASLPTTCTAAVTDTSRLRVADQTTIVESKTGSSVDVCVTESLSPVNSAASNPKRKKKKKKGSCQSGGTGDSVTKSESTQIDTPVVDDMSSSALETPVQTSSVSTFTQELE